MGFCIYHVKDEEKMWTLDSLTNNIVGDDKISISEPDSDSGLGSSYLRATKFLIL